MLHSKPNIPKVHNVSRCGATDLFLSFFSPSLRSISEHAVNIVAFCIVVVVVVVVVVAVV